MSELEMDLVDLDNRDIDDDVRLIGVADFDRIDHRIVFVHPLGHGLIAALIADLALTLTVNRAVFLPVFLQRAFVASAPFAARVDVFAAFAA